MNMNCIIYYYDRKSNKDSWHPKPPVAACGGHANDCACITHAVEREDWMEVQQELSTRTCMRIRTASYVRSTEKHVNITKNDDPAKKKQANVCFVYILIISLFHLTSKGRSPYYTMFQVGASI